MRSCWISNVFTFAVSSFQLDSFSGRNPHPYVDEIRRDRLVVCLRADHPLAANTSIQPADLQAHPRLLLRGLAGAQTEIGIAVMAYNLKRIVNVLGATRFTQALTPA
jgi:DNA-binding transcriptional LysR family regulator